MRIRSLCTLLLLGATAAAGCSDGSSASGPGPENLEKGRAFLAQNGGKDGVVTLDSGLQYVVLREGEGARPHIYDSVALHYRGSHLDGKEIHSSYGGDPESVLVRGAIPGWREALLRMREGAKWRLYIPHYLAFTNRGVEGMIEPNETVIYDLELVKVEGGK